MDTDRDHTTFNLTEPLDFITGGNKKDHRFAGRLGGIQTLARYGSSHMHEIGKLGGRPSREESAARAWERLKNRKIHVG